MAGTLKSPQKLDPVTISRELAVRIFWTIERLSPIEETDDENDGGENQKEQTKPKQSGIPHDASVCIKGVDYEHNPITSDKKRST
jgi:hypothetical protein